MSVDDNGVYRITEHFGKYEAEMLIKCKICDEKIISYAGWLITKQFEAD